jgi:hypothetical protein
MNTEEKTEITDIETLGVIFLWESCEVPGFQPVSSKLDTLNSLSPCFLKEELYFFIGHPVILIIV